MIRRYFAIMIIVAFSFTVGLILHTANEPNSEVVAIEPGLSHETGEVLCDPDLPSMTAKLIIPPDGPNQPTHPPLVDWPELFYPLYQHDYTVYFQVQNESGSYLLDEETVVITVQEGCNFIVYAPNIEGYTPNQRTIKGTMGDSDNYFVVTYTPDKTATGLEIDFD